MVNRDAGCYILRIQKEDLEKQLYGQRILYVNIKRDWIHDTRLLLMKKATFIGSGIIDRFVSFSELSEDEKRICFQTSCYGRIECSKLVRFYPAVAIEDTSIAGQNILGLHGASLVHSAAIQIERIARSRLII